jgi:uncharacterized phiE125 gp8 family phage protein
MNWEWSLVTGPAQEPITDSEAKLHAGISGTDDDTLMTAYVKAARQAAEVYLACGLYTQTWRLQLSAFYDVIWLPMAAPLASVTSVKYYDTTGTEQTLATTYYTVDTTSTPGRIVRAPNQSWPSVQCDRLRPVTITYVVGQTTTASIPEIVKQGIRVYVAYLEAHRMGDPNSEVARQAAYALWDLHGRAHWREPESCL